MVSSCGSRNPWPFLKKISPLLAALLDYKAVEKGSGVHLSGEPRGPELESLLGWERWAGT